MARKLTTFLIAFVMVFTAVGFTATVEADAASQTPYMTTGDGDDGVPREKVGNYYIWVDNGSAYEEIDDDAESVEMLKCAKSLNVEPKVLKTLGDGKQFGFKIVTNGKTIYYTVWNYEKNLSTIYKTTVSGGKHTVVKKFKKCDSVEVVAVYNGRVYYTKELADKEGYLTANLYSFSLKNKKVRLEKSDVWATSSYGRYIVCDNDFKNIKTPLYNAKTRKSKSLINSLAGYVYKNNVYHLVYKNDKMVIKKTNLSGKVLKTYKALGEDYMITYVGHKAAYAYNEETGVTKKLTYKTGKWTVVK